MSFKGFCLLGGGIFLKLGRTFPRRMIALYCCFHKRDHLICLNKEFHLDLRWRHKFLSQLHGVSSWLLPVPQSRRGSFFRCGWIIGLWSVFKGLLVCRSMGAFSAATAAVAAAAAACHCFSFSAEHVPGFTDQIADALLFLLAGIQVAGPTHSASSNSKPS